MATWQKEDEVWDNLGTTTSLNLALLFARFHAKIIPWGHDSQDFVQLGFSGGEEDEYDEDEDMYP